MGDREKASLRLQFNPQIRLELPGRKLHGATITSDAGLLAFRELDDALDLTPIASRTISRKAVPAATSATTWSLCSASPSTAAWPATMIPTMQNVFPRPSHESCRGLARLRAQRRQNQHHEPF